MSHLQKLLSRLKQVRSTGKHQWLACCPAHGDRKPSLGIGIGGKGQIMLRCRSQECRVDEIVGAVGLCLSDLYPPDSRFVATGRGLQTCRPPLPRWARPGNEERLRRAVACLFLLAADAYPEGSPSRELAAFAMGEASEILGGVL